MQNNEQNVLFIFMCVNSKMIHERLSLFLSNAHVTHPQDKTATLWSTAYIKRFFCCHDNYRNTVGPNTENRKHILEENENLWTSKELD